MESLHSTSEVAGLSRDEMRRAAASGERIPRDQTWAIKSRRSIPEFELRPVGGVGAFAMTQPEVAMMLVVHDPGRVECAQIGDLFIGVAIVGRVVAKREHGLAGVAVPAPVEIIL